jgi:hypothetical protein
VLEYVRDIRRKSPRDVVTVFIPEYVGGHWWEQLLHNQSALRLKSRLLFQPGVMVTSVAYQLRSSTGHDGDERSSPGDVRRGTWPLQATDAVLPATADRPDHGIRFRVARSADTSQSRGLSRVATSNGGRMATAQFWSDHTLAVQEAEVYRSRPPTPSALSFGVVVRIALLAGAAIMVMNMTATPAFADTAAPAGTEIVTAPMSWVGFDPAAADASGTPYEVLSDGSYRVTDPDGVQHVLPGLTHAVVAATYVAAADGPVRCDEMPRPIDGSISGPNTDSLSPDNAADPDAPPSMEVPNYLPDGQAPTEPAAPLIGSDATYLPCDNPLADWMQFTQGWTVGNCGVSWTYMFSTSKKGWLQYNGGWSIRHPATYQSHLIKFTNLESGISKRVGPSASNLFFRSSWSKTGLRYVGSGFTVAQGYYVAVANWGGVCSGIARDVDNIY